MVKKLKTIICLMFAFCFLCGCATSVDFVVYSDGIYTYNELAFTFSDVAIAEVERTATTDKTSDKPIKWTVENYLKGFMAKYTSYEFDTIMKDGRTIKYYFTRTREGTGELPIIHEKREIKEGFFFVDLVDTYTNPYVEYRAAFIKAAENSKDHTSLFGALLNGDRTYAGSEQPDDSYIQDETGKYYKENYPSIFSAFPFLEGQNLSDIATNFLMAAPSRTKTNGSTVYGNEDNKFYAYSTSFSDDGAKILLSGIRFNPIGWFTIAAALGGLTVGILLLVKHYNKKKKNAPKHTDVKDLFPYDPFS